MAMPARLTEEVRCARCGHTCSAASWRALPRQRTLRPDELAGYVSRWPLDAVVEVRACSGCGSAMARRAPSLSA